MLTQPSAVLLVLFVVSVASRVMAETAEPSRLQHAHRLLERAFQVADAEHVHGTLALQHAATALAFLEAARECATDAELERAAGVDVARAQRRLERALATARQNLAPVPK
jgi:hypothetical protein